MKYSNRLLSIGGFALLGGAVLTLGPAALTLKAGLLWGFGVSLFGNLVHSALSTPSRKISYNNHTPSRPFTSRASVPSVNSVDLGPTIHFPTPEEPRSSRTEIHTPVVRAHEPPSTPLYPQITYTYEERPTRAVATHATVHKSKGKPMKKGPNSTIERKDTKFIPKPGATSSVEPTGNRTFIPVPQTPTVTTSSPVRPSAASATVSVEAADNSRFIPNPAASASTQHVNRTFVPLQKAKESNSTATHQGSSFYSAARNDGTTTTHVGKKFIPLPK